MIEQSLSGETLGTKASISNEPKTNIAQIEDQRGPFGCIEGAWRILGLQDTKCSSEQPGLEAHYFVSTFFSVCNRVIKLIFTFNTIILFYTSSALFTYTLLLIWQFSITCNVSFIVKRNILLLYVWPTVKLLNMYNINTFFIIKQNS